MAEAVGRVASTVRAWTDPDRPEQVSLDAAIDLDLLFISEGGEGAPLYEAFGGKLSLAHARRFSEARRLHDFAGPLVKEAGEAHSAIIEAARPDATRPEFDRAFKEAMENFEKLLDILPFLAEQAGKSHLLPRFVQAADHENEHQRGTIVAQAP